MKWIKNKIAKRALKGKHGGTIKEQVAKVKAYQMKFGLDTMNRKLAQIVQEIKKESYAEKPAKYFRKQILKKMFAEKELKTNEDKIIRGRLEAVLEDYAKKDCDGFDLYFLEHSFPSYIEEIVNKEAVEIMQEWSRHGKQ